MTTEKERRVYPRQGLLNEVTVTVIDPVGGLRFLQMANVSMGGCLLYIPTRQQCPKPQTILKIIIDLPTYFGRLELEGAVIRNKWDKAKTTAIQWGPMNTKQHLSLKLWISYMKNKIIEKVCLQIKDSIYSPTKPRKYSLLLIALTSLLTLNSCTHATKVTLINKPYEPYLLKDTAGSYCIPSGMVITPRPQDASRARDARGGLTSNPPRYIMREYFSNCNVVKESYIYENP